MQKVVLEHTITVPKVSKFAQKHGLAFQDKFDANDDRPGEVIWVSDGAADRLHRIDDQFSGLVYLIVEGEHEAALTAAASEELNGLTLETLATAMHGHDDRALSKSSIASLGVLAPEHCQKDILDLFRWMLHHKDPAVREAAISATGYAAWPELVPELAQVAADDPLSELRDYAQIAIDSFDSAQ